MNLIPDIVAQHAELTEWRRVSMILKNWLIRTILNVKMPAPCINPIMILTMRLFP